MSFERILTVVLIPALILVTLPQLGVQVRTDDRALERTALKALSGLLLGTATEENELFTLTLDAPDEVAPGEPFTVTEEITAKVELEFAAVVSELPEGVELVSGELRGFEIGLQAGERLTHEYEVRATREGTFTLRADAKAKPSDAASQGLGAQITVNAVPANQKPIATFGVSPREPKAGDQITFDASGSTDPDGQIANYRWDLGDGTVLEGPDKVTVTHAYEKQGTYRVTLVVVDNEGAPSDPRAVSLAVERRPTFFEQIPTEVWIGLGVVVGAGLVFFLGRALIGALAGPPAGPAPAPTPGRPAADLAGLVTQDAERFIQSTGLPLAGVTDVQIEAQVKKLDRAKWVRTLLERALILSTDGGTLTVTRYGDLSQEERDALDPGRLGATSLVGFVSERVAPGDTIVKLTWQTSQGETIESWAVISSDGRVKFDTLMSFQPLDA